MSEYAVNGVCIESEANHDSGAGATPSEGRAEYSNRLVKRRRHSGEVATRRYALQNFCRECVGFNSGGLGSITENIRHKGARHRGFDVSRHYPLFHHIVEVPLRELSGRHIYPIPIQISRKARIIELPNLTGNHKPSPMAPRLRIPLPLQRRKCLRHHVGMEWRPFKTGGLESSPW